MFKIGDIARATKHITRKDMVCGLREGQVAKITSVHNSQTPGVQIVAVKFWYESSGREEHMIDIVCENNIPLELCPPDEIPPSALKL